MSPVLPATIPASRVDRAHRQKPGRPLVMASRNEIGEWLVIDPGAPLLEVATWTTWHAAFRDANQIAYERAYRGVAHRLDAA